MNITTTDFDTLLERIVNAVTEMVQNRCDRKFKQTTYSNEVHSVYGARQEYFALRNLPVTTLIAAQYRAGTPSNPSWTSFTADEYELVEDGEAGLVKIYGGARGGVNAVRFTYTAGYLIDFDNPLDTTKHTLPYDLSDLVERVTIKMFKRREHEGKASENLEGASVTWGNYFDEFDEEVIAKYTRVPQLA